MALPGVKKPYLIGAIYTIYHPIYNWFFGPKLVVVTIESWVAFFELAGGEEEEETAEVTTKMRVDLVAKMIQSLAGKTNQRFFWGGKGCFQE